MLTAMPSTRSILRTFGFVGEVRMSRQIEHRTLFVSRSSAPAKIETEQNAKRRRFLMKTNASDASEQAQAAMILWQRVFGDNLIPPTTDFELWCAKYDESVVRRATAVTAQKHQQMGGTMSLIHRIRFASRVMSTNAKRRN
jgi:hypothetical protein